MRAEFNSNLKLKVILLKRLNDKYAQFDIFDLDTQKTADQTVDTIKEHINAITIGTKKLSFKMTTPEFYDESSPVNILFYSNVFYLECYVFCLE